MIQQVSTPQEPHELVWALTTAGVASRCLHVVAELGVADEVDEDAVSAEVLAARCGADADALDRAMRLLTAHNVFERTAGGFRHTPASRLLRSDHPMSMRAFPRMIGLPVMAAAFAQLEHSIRTGAPAVETVDPRGIWSYFEDHPNEAQIFGQAMTARAAAYVATILPAYDFGRFETIADIGGGRGHLLQAVLDRAPKARGILFDVPAVIDSLDVEHKRLRTQAGDFFVDALPAADAYLLMQVLHDWGDTESVKILSAIRHAAAPGAVVLVMEHVLADEGIDVRAQTLDLLMLAVMGGRERTPSELNQLFHQAGFSDGTVIATSGPIRIVETSAI